MKTEKSTPVRGGIYQVQTSLVAEARIATLIDRIEVLELQGHPQANQISSSMCNGCGALDHILKECSSLKNPIENGLEQVNADYQRPINDPYAPTYNLGWRNHPNFS